MLISQESSKSFYAQKIKSSRKFNDEFLKEMREYVKNNNASNEHFMQGFSFRESIAVLETYKEKIFTDENIKSLDRLSGDSKSLEELANKADEQIRYITQCRNYFHKYILKEDWYFE